jgi:hypothetical protein
MFGRRKKRGRHDDDRRHAGVYKHPSDAEQRPILPADASEDEWNYAGGPSALGESGDPEAPGADGPAEQHEQPAPPPIAPIATADDEDMPLTGAADDAGPAGPAESAEPVGSADNEAAPGGGADAGDRVIHLMERVQSQVDALDAIEQEKAQLEALLERESAQAATREAELRAEGESLAAQVVELERRLAEVEAGQSDSQTGDDSAELRAALAEATGARDAAEAECAALRERIESLEREVASERDRLAEAGRHLREAQQRAQDAEERAAAVASTGGDDDARFEAEMAKRDRALQLLKQRLDESEALIEELEGRLTSENQGEASPAATAAPVGHAALPTRQNPRHDFALALRRERLSYVRRELRDRGATLKRKRAALERSAKELKERVDQLAAHERALKQREAGIEPRERTVAEREAQLDTKLREAQDILTQREQVERYAEKIKADRKRLATTEQQLEKKAKRVASAAARSRAALTMLWIVLTVGVLGVASWFAAGKFATPEFLVATTLEAMGDGEPLTAERRGAWQRYMADLTGNAQLHERAAQRLKRMGFAEYTSPTDVARLLEGDNADFISERDGTLTMTIRGEGERRTVRLADTIAASMTALANETKGVRRDNASTGIALAAAAGAAPVDDPRTQLFGMLWGASTAVALFGAVVLWRKFVADRSAFERRMSEAEDLVAFDDADNPPSA